jgi:RHS repeat-associated protein
MSRPRYSIIVFACASLLMLALGYWLASGPLPSSPPLPPPQTSSPQPTPTLATASAKIRWTEEARPTERTSLLLLDLSKVPSEKDLRMAGQLGEELVPTRLANPSDITDAAKRVKQELENMDFGKAIQKWNLHEYEQAYAMFLGHLEQFPESAWAAEAELHLGCYCQYKGMFEESQKWFEASQARSPTGHGMNAKATLRLGALAMEQGKYKSATEHFASLRAASDTPAHSTYASYWITRLSLFKGKQTAMRNCAQKSLAEVCATLGKEEEARKLRAVENKNPDGLNLQEIEDLAALHGLKAQTVFTTSAHLADLPLPFIAHYEREEHFVTVLAFPEKGKLRVYDTRVGNAHDLDAAFFLRQWSGHAVIFTEKPANAEVLLASAESKRRLIGGCCGEPKEPDDLSCGRKQKAGCSSCGMPEWSVNPVNMNLQITDTPMWWDAPYGPSVHMTLTYNSLDSLVSIRPFGDKWTFAYSAFAMEDPAGNVVVMYGNGYTERFTKDVNTNTYQPLARNASSSLTKPDPVNTPYTYIVEDGDGEKWTFSVPTTMQGASAASLLTSIADKYGSAVTITHNAQGAVTAVSHSALPVGQNTWSLVYGANGKVASMSDPFGRTATFTYTEVNGQQRLTGQTDMGGVAYGYGYTTASQVRERDPLYPNFGHTQEFATRSNELFINSLNLPTGAWQFLTEPADGIEIPLDTYPAPGANTWETYRITITDPLGQQEEYFYAALFKGWHRDRKHYRQGVPAYGENSGDLHDPATRYSYTLAGGRGEIWRTEHQGGGVTESPSYSYNNAGQPAQVTAPDGKITKYTYNNKFNVLTRQEGANNDPNKIIYTTTYAANGMDVLSQTRTIGNGTPIPMSTSTYDPVTRDILTQTSHVWHSGAWQAQTTSFTYNAQGQVLTTTSPRGAVTQNTYFTAGFQKGRLEKVEYKAPGQTVFKTQAQYVYDDIGRIIAEQDAEGYLLTHEYDLLNRRLKTTYPDTTYTQSVYSCCTLTSSRARDGSITQYTYDALKRVTQVVSPGGQTVAYEYDPNDNVTKLRFGRGEWVAWEYDDGNRVTAKLYPDGSKLQYSYDRAKGGRLEWTKDASNRQTTYHYNADQRLWKVTHPSLPEQSYTFDAEGRTLTWTDGTGGTARVTGYIYDPNGRLQTLDGPLADDTLAYNYDQWGRLTSWSYAGGTESYTFDNLDRVVQIINPLGTFTQSYEGDTGILTEVQYPLAGMKTTYQRLPTAQDRLLTAIIHTKPTSQGGGELARYDYTYNAQRQIATWRQMQPGMDAKEWAIAYDARQQVTAVVETPVAGPPQNPQQVWRYQYDASGNRTAAQEGSRTRTATYNELNQLVSQSAGGSTWFRGKVNEPANVTINGQNARVSADGTFESLTTVGPGQQDVLMQATDKAGNTTNQTWRVDNGPTGNVATTHDAEGNLLTDGRYTYTWDAKNRMTNVTLGPDTWTFTYDGQNRRIAESKNGQPVRTWVWNNTQIVEERTATDGAKQRRWKGGVEFLDSGNQPTAKCLLITDHLGSTRVAMDGTTGTPTASYAFSPWGKRSRISGTEEFSNGYTGHLWHESGLSLAVYRPYDPETGRWPSRDPIEENGGMNVYCCVNNRSIMLRDYLGQVPDGGGGGYFYHLVIVKQRYKPANLQKPCACPTLEGRSSTRLGPWVGNELDQVALKAEAESALVKQKDPQGCVPDGGWVTSFVEGFKSDGRGTT